MEWDRPRDDQLVVTLIVGKGGRSKGLGREQLGVGVGNSARRLLESLGVDIGPEPAQKVASRALHRVVVDLSGLGLGTAWLGQRKRRDALLIQGHALYAPRTSEFLPTAA